MTDRDQQIAIAECCGFTNIRENDAPHGPRVLIGTRSGRNLPVPDYVHDQNATHEAICEMDASECLEFLFYLGEIVSGANPEADALRISFLT